VREPLEKPEAAKQKLQATMDAAAAAGIKCVAAVVAPPVGITNTGRRIIAAATREGADAIVIGARGTGVLRKLLGSVSSYVVSRAPMSVCVVR
jgi:nucleotide-binding universal stress UspA family protein